MFIGTSQNVGTMNDDLLENWALSLLAKEFIFNNVLKVTVLPSSVTFRAQGPLILLLLMPLGPLTVEHSGSYAYKSLIDLKFTPFELFSLHKGVAHYTPNTPPCGFSHK